MATGDANDIFKRLYRLLPVGWFPDVIRDISTAPNLATVLYGMAGPLAYAYSLLMQVNSSTRLASCTGVLLDVAAQDFFGVGKFPRQANEADGAYLARIQAQIFAPRNTRAAIVNALSAETLTQSALIESRNAADCGVYGPNPPTPVGYGQSGIRYSGSPGQVFYEGIGSAQSFPNICAILEKNKAEGVLFWVRVLDAAALETDFGGDVL